MPAITLPDGSIRRYDAALSGSDLAADIGPGPAKAALAVRVDGVIRDLGHSLDADAHGSIVTAKDGGAPELIRPDAPPVRGEAVQEP